MKGKEAAACALQRARLARRFPSWCARTESSHLQIGGQVFQDEASWRDRSAGLALRRQRDECIAD